ncbi:unnamed protein product [Chrysodeixis includens]|uniref:THAP-type domain-containing protein n=1 Tax=Chrysodeixis includens TaxID=689277 RepID=A0A9P0FUZ3_CHRIL|nr:unnamed protein product [Chrysodeixis includens]
MVQCAIKGCSSRSDVHTALDHKFTFHRLPKFSKNDVGLTAYIKCEVTDSTRICSRHFTEHNFYHTSTGKRRLKRDAVPDIHLDLNEGRQGTSKLLKRKNVPNTDLTTTKNVYPEPSIRQSDESTFQLYTPKKIKFVPLVPLNTPKETTIILSKDEIMLEDDLNYEEPGHAEELEDEERVKVKEFQYEETEQESEYEEEIQNEGTSEINGDIGTYDEFINRGTGVEFPSLSNGETPMERELKDEVKKLRLLCDKRLEVIKSLRLENTMLVQKIESLINALD